MAATAFLIAPTTPPDYHRIISPTLKVPSDPEVSVLASVAQSPPAAANGPGKKAKKAVLAPEIPNAPLLLVLLHDTVIFPEGGGQPTDTGRITTSEDSALWEVVQAKRHGGHAVHYVKVREGLDVETALLAFQAGAKVTVALGEEGYERRYDHMSMHTSQHMLSALLETRLNLPTLSWSLTSYPSPCYVEVPRGMTQDEIASIQAEANKLVFEGRRVHVEVEELDPVQEQANTVPKLESGRSVGKALPEDYTGGVKRVVVIDGVDRNPCCGTHLPSIHNLQLFLLPHTEALSRSSTTSARLTASILSCGPPLVPDRVTQVVEERKRAEKRVSDTEQELAEHIAKGLWRRSGLFKYHVHRTDDTANALGFLTAIAFALGASMPPAGEATCPYVIVLSSSPSTQTTTSVSTVLVLGSDDSKVKAVGDGLKTKLGVKGGGKESRENAAVEDVLNTL
ncbi:hypothetical protein BDZ97DRAFT_1935250 [Flammula alnicola]|nr:hypothetical protein BDZ97DRAFT_1935250 [Flammula alnicola]